jgi:hypothetical protein
VRAALADQAERWRWCSAWWRGSGKGDGPVQLASWPVPVSGDWLAWVNTPQTVVPGLVEGRQHVVDPDLQAPPPRAKSLEADDDFDAVQPGSDTGGSGCGKPLMSDLPAKGCKNRTRVLTCGLLSVYKGNGRTEAKYEARHSETRKC